MATKKIKPSAADEVSAFMEALVHPMRNEMEDLRAVIRSVSPAIEERIKWNAPSYHVNNVDFVTFNPRDKTRIHLVFHHPSVETIRSGLLEGDYRGRRMVYFESAAALKRGKTELKAVIRKILSVIGKS